MAKRRPKSEHFAKLPVSVLESAACATLPLAAFKVLTLLASGYSGSNNGTLSCTESWARKFGITGTDTVRLALKELERRGLVEVTRRGMRMKKVRTLYALTWLSVDNRDARPIAIPAPASHRYAEYDGHIWDKDGDRWMEKNFHPERRGSVTPTRGVEASKYTPNGGARSAVYTPTSGDTLDLGRAPIDSKQPPDQRSAVRTIEVRIQKARKFIAEAPATDNGKVAGMFGLTDEQVRELRAAG